MAVDGFWENSYCFKYRSEWELLARLPDISSTIYEYTGDEESPRWMTTAKGMDSVFLFRPNFTDRRYAGGFRPEFRACCTVYADLTGAKYHKYLGVGDVPYWQVSFRTRIFVAQTMLKAQLVWTDQYVSDIRCCLSLWHELTNLDAAFRVVLAKDQLQR